MLGTTFTLAIRSILRHKLRSFLTTLGIIIGVAAVVAMVTLGNATTAAVQQQIASLGTNILQVRPGQGFGRGGGGPRPPDFEQQDVEAIGEQIAGVTAVAPQAQAAGTAIYNGANWSTTINGTTNAFFQVQPWPLTGGRTFSAAEEAAGKAVCPVDAPFPPRRKRRARRCASSAIPCGKTCSAAARRSGDGSGSAMCPAM